MNQSLVKKKQKKQKRKLPPIEYCKQCPHAHEHNPFADCTHPDNPDKKPRRIFWKDYQDGVIPDWCKLELED